MRLAKDCDARGFEGPMGTLRNATVAELRITLAVLVLLGSVSLVYAYLRLGLWEIAATLGG